MWNQGEPSYKALNELITSLQKDNMLQHWLEIVENHGDEESKKEIALAQALKAKL